MLHLIPTQAALGTGSIDPLSYWDFARQIPILGTAAMSFRVNLDGALGLRNEVEGVVHGYTQLFRNGFVEAVQVLSENARGTRILHGSTYE
ncbi:hypothetical protein, partial [Paraburkholderia sp. SIMBA_053]|uniref:hypothetical protein n=1 Tax=Paraburkholderia sp. SIMBA_053 TaxID=3085794 RepID=UPI003979FFEE